MQEVTNAVQQSVKEIQQRFDFKGSKSSIELNKEAAEITLVSDDEYKLKSLPEIHKANLSSGMSRLNHWCSALSKKRQGTPCDKS